jgi:hypothetical protein
MGDRKIKSVKRHPAFRILLFKMLFIQTSMVEVSGFRGPPTGDLGRALKQKVKLVKKNVLVITGLS